MSEMHAPGCSYCNHLSASKVESPKPAVLIAADNCLDAIEQLQWALSISESAA